jgi:hypothetical protein
MEIEGVPMALLSHPKQVEMFWVSYRLTPLTAKAEVVVKLQSVEFWRDFESHEVAFRNRASSAIARSAFPSLSPFPEPGRIVMRGLYIPI